MTNRILLYAHADENTIHFRTVSARMKSPQRFYITYGDGDGPEAHRSDTGTHAAQDRDAAVELAGAWPSMASLHGAMRAPPHGLVPLRWGFELVRQEWDAVCRATDENPRRSGGLAARRRCGRNRNSTKVGYPLQAPRPPVDLWTLGKRPDK